MAEKLNIRVSVENNQTVSKFSVADSGKVIFHNQAQAELTVTFGEPLLLCKNGDTVSEVKIPAGKDETLKVCNATAGQSFKYTAEVAGAGAEDPIVIIESAGFVGSSLSFSAAGAAIAFALTYGVLKLRSAGKTKTQAQS